MTDGLNVHDLGSLGIGALLWTFPADGALSFPPVVAGRFVYVASNANVYAVDAATGTLLWQRRVDDHPVARVTGSPAFHNGRLYVPVASGEEGTGAASDYGCCRFRGSLVALDGSTGEQIWKTYTIAEQARPTKANKVGTMLWGPSGAPIWTAPAIDPSRNAVYVTTGDNYSDPPTPTSDA